MSDTDALTTAMTDLVAAERAFADARQRLDATDREIGTREAEVRNAQQVFAEQLEAGETGTKAQLAWAKARTALAALQERREPLAAAIKKRREQLARARISAALTRQQQQLTEANELGRVLWQQVADVIANVRELIALETANRTARDVILQASRELSGDAPGWRTILVASELSSDVWETLQQLSVAVQHADAQRARIERAGVARVGA